MNEWNVLFYLNGQNELGFEMEETFFKLKELSLQLNLGIIIEIGKESETLIEMFRSEKRSYVEPWTGIRRYAYQQGQCHLVEELSEGNQADANHLKEFLDWGMKNYRAKRYVVVISGHGFLELCLTDFKGDRPYSMGIYELSQVLKQVAYPIDILILDICYANTIELMYELGFDFQKINYVLTYFVSGILQGLDYKDVLPFLDDRPTLDSLHTIVRTLSPETIAVKLDPSHLQDIWRLSNQLTFWDLIIKEQGFNDINGYTSLVQELENRVTELIIDYKSECQTPIFLYFLYQNDFQLTDVQTFSYNYFKLSFTKGHYGQNLLLGLPAVTPLRHELSKSTQQILTLHDLAIIYLLYHPHETSIEAMMVVHQLALKKGWII